LNDETVTLIIKGLELDFETCINKLDAFDPYSKWFNIVAKTISEGLSAKYSGDNFVVTVGYSMNFYNNWSTVHTHKFYTVWNGFIYLLLNFQKLNNLSNILKFQLKKIKLLNSILS
jgi:hypothetical protein